MIWQGICSCGLKTKVFITSTTMNSKVYIEECLKKRILPFIRQHKTNVMFWPDLASCHYSKEVLEWYAANNVNFVAKEINPPNCPEFRPIEQYWAIVKRKLRGCGKEVTNAQQMRLKWNKFADTVSPATVQTMMASITSKVRQFVRSGEM